MNEIRLKGEMKRNGTKGIKNCVSTKIIIKTKKQTLLDTQRILKRSQKINHTKKHGKYTIITLT